VKLTDLPTTYRAQFGLDHEADLRPVDGPEVAKAYLAMPHQPEAPLVRASYDVFKRDLEGQYDFLRDNDFLRDTVGPAGPALQFNLRDDNGRAVSWQSLRVPGRGTPC
jgi:hypothetical protein